MDLFIIAVFSVGALLIVSIGAWEIRRVKDEAHRKTRTLERTLQKLEGRVEVLERAEERQADRWMEEGMENILGFTPELARKGAGYADGTGGL